MSEREFPTGRFSDMESSADRFDPFGPSKVPARRSSAGCWIAAILIGSGISILICCGGGALLVRFGLQIVTSEIEDQLADNPILREHIGELQSFEMDWARSFGNDDEETFVYQARGTQGEGRVTVKHITSEDGSEIILSAELRLPSGEVIDLLGDADATGMEPE